MELNRRIKRQNKRGVKDISWQPEEDLSLSRNAYSLCYKTHYCFIQSNQLAYNNFKYELQNYLWEVKSLVCVVHWQRHATG